MIDNDDTLSTKEYAKISGTSRGTVYTRFDQMERLGIVKYTQKSSRGRKKMVVTAISVWVAWVVLGRTDAVDVILSEVEKQFVDVQQWIVLIIF